MQQALSEPAMWVQSVQDKHQCHGCLHGLLQMLAVNTPASVLSTSLHKSRPEASQAIKKQNALQTWQSTHSYPPAST
jgi:hypothetical protein